MIKIWSEQIALLGVVDTDALYRSTVAVSMTADGKFTSVTLSQSFTTYGLFVDWGVGNNTNRGNPGDIGRTNPRKRSSQSAFVVKRKILCGGPPPGDIRESLQCDLSMRLRYKLPCAIAVLRAGPNGHPSFYHSCHNRSTDPIALKAVG